jgi:hypothetical protein
VSEALVKIDAPDLALDRPHPREIIRQATEEANVLAEVIEKQRLYSMIQGKKFVKCEGWVTLATLRGCLPREVAVHEMPEGRYVAEVELVRMSDGMVLTRASSECGGPEDPIWQKRPPNARRSMAITRATGKSARVAFSWVMALTGYEVTPAEEMDFVGGTNQEATSGPAPRANEAAPRQWPARGVSPPTVAAQREANRADAGPPVWRGKLVGVETKQGVTNKKPWTLYTLTGSDGQKFGTFSETIATGLTALDGRFVEIVYSQTAKGNMNIEEYRDVTQEEAPFSE